MQRVASGTGLGQGDLSQLPCLAGDLGNLLTCSKLSFSICIRTVIDGSDVTGLSMVWDNT